MDQPFSPTRRSWPQKFAGAFRGWLLGTRGQSSFHVHLPAAVAVVAAGILLHVNATEWCALVLCITLVLAAELLNSALESLAKAVVHTEDPHVGRALDIASGAVLMTATGSVIVALIIFVPRLSAL